MKLLDRRFLAGKPSEDLLRRNLAANPNNFARILDDHLAHKAYAELSKRVPGGKDRFDFEWLINPFQFACQTIQDSQLIAFADYLNASAVWQYAAPHFLDSSASTRVLHPMMERCPKDKVKDLANRLNARGLLSASVKSIGWSNEDIARNWGVALT